MRKAYSYLRFSTPEQARGDSTRRQTTLARDYAVRHGLTFEDMFTFRDLGVSGFTGTNVRQGALGQFLRAIDEGHVEPGSFLLVENLDRVSRQNPWDALPVFQQIINAGVTIVTLQDERVWSQEDMRANPFRMFESLMVMIRAHEESATKSRRLKASWSNKRAQAGGQPLTSRAPAWLELMPDRRGWRVREDRADVVRRIYALAAAGTGEHSIAATLNREGVEPFGDRARKGTHWQRSYIAKVLRSSAVAGTFTPHTVHHENGRRVRKAEASVEGYFPAVVDRETFESVRALQMDATNPQRGRHAAGTVQNVLGGLASCPLCGSTMTRVSKGNSPKHGKATFVCTNAKSGAGCRYRAVRVEDVEAALVGSRGWLESTGPAGAAADELTSRLAENRAEQEREVQGQARLIEAAKAGEWSEPQALRDALAEAEQNLKILKAGERDLLDRIDVSEGPALGKRLAALRDALGTAPLDRQSVNVILRQLLSRVIVDYRCGLLVLKWKHGGESVLRFAQAESVEDVPEKWRAAAAFFARTRSPASHPAPHYGPTLAITAEMVLESGRKGRGKPGKAPKTAE